MTYQPVSLIPDPASNRVWDNMRRIAEWTRVTVPMLAGSESAPEIAPGTYVTFTDFDNTVVSPTGGYAQCEVVVTGTTIAIYAPQGGGLTHPQVLARGLGC
jgi:hypothetical protein